MCSQMDFQNFNKKNFNTFCEIFENIIILISKIKSKNMYRQMDFRKNEYEKFLNEISLSAQLFIIINSIFGFLVIRLFSKTKRALYVRNAEKAPTTLL